MSVPDLHFINQKIAIGDVARALELRFGANGNIHCWHPERHQNSDRTASVGINKKTNTVKCFGCGLGPLGTVDLVRAVLEVTNPGDAGLWVSERFEVPYLLSSKHLVSPEQGCGVKSSPERRFGLASYSSCTISCWRITRRSGKKRRAARSTGPKPYQYSDRFR